MRFSIGLVGCALALSVGASGCFGDLKGVKVANDLGGAANDGGGGGSDAGGGGSDGGGGGSDGGSGDLAAVDKTCALPHLQIALVDQRSSSSVTRVQRVLRIPLDGRPACAPLVRGNALGESFALGFLPPSTTLYGETAGRVRFIEQDDTESKAPYTPGDNHSPTHLFVLRDESNAPRIAVAYDASNSPEIPWPRRIDILDRVDWSTRTERWEIGISEIDQLIRTEFLVAVDADPRDATKFLTFRNQYPYATDVFTPPWAGTAVTPTTYVDSLGTSDMKPKALRTLRQGDVSRFAWLFETKPNLSNPIADHVVLRREKEGESPAQWGPITCTNNTACAEPLLLADVMPDFEEPDTVLATCYVSQSLVTQAPTSNLIRIRADGQCETLLGGDTFPENHFLVSLGAALIP